MKKFTKAVGILLLTGLLIPWADGTAQQQTTDDEAKEVVSSGMGSITGGDIAHARDDAIEDALRTGVEQALGMILSSESLVENFQLIEDKIFTKTQGYVQNYQVIHTSGFLLIEKQLYYECYLNLNLDETKAMGLDASLNKIKNIFKQIKIEEIGLKKHI